MVLFGPRKRLGLIEKEILESITAGDMLVGFLCSARSSRRMYKVARERAVARYRTQKAIDSLITKGWATRKGDYVGITSDGKFELDKAILNAQVSLRDRVWDGKWRIISYDIPESHSKLRDRVRAILKRAGFAKLHHSIWIFPHECRELSDLIKRDRRLKSYILYGVLENIEGTERLRKLFELDDHFTDIAP